ncbi:MAG TPA: DNRLRE domain-containing protein [Micromonosporaceae bacterium]|nr:DNRLRE domain-containing protein [Micromonosporaceae bacterium]
MASDWNPTDWTSTTTPRPRRRGADEYGLPRQYGPGSRWYEPDPEDQDDYYSSTELPVYVPDRDPDPDIDDYSFEPLDPIEPLGPLGSEDQPAAAGTRTLTRTRARTPQGHRPQRSALSLIGIKVVVAAMAVALLGASGGLVVAWVRAEPASAVQDITVPVAEDTFYVDQEPAADHSGATELLAVNRLERKAVTFLKFDVPELPRNSRVVAATLKTRSPTPQPAGAELYRVTDTTWMASELKDSGPPSHTDRVATGPATAGATSFSFDLTRVVTTSGTYAFALDIAAGTTHEIRIFASEHGNDGPRLVVSWTPVQAKGNSPPEAMLQPGQSAGSPLPTALPSASASFGSPTRPVPGGRMLAGASVQLRTGETYSQGLARADRTYGPLEMVRVFYPGLPPSWAGSRADVANRTVVVSFKALPLDIIAGKHDAQLSTWFASAPRTRDTYWVYYHEPEDNIAAGNFTATDYRAAWRHLAGLANRTGNSRLHATLVLMCYSLNPDSGRNWRDYYPGGDIIDVLGWDCYNYGRKKGEYASPASIYGKSIEVSRATGKPFGYAETGSTLLPEDTGAGRAAWLRSVGTYLNSHNPLWVAYFDTMLSVDFRLLDSPSQQAWQSVCRS